MWQKNVSRKSLFSKGRIVFNSTGNLLFMAIVVAFLASACRLNDNTIRGSFPTSPETNPGPADPGPPTQEKAVVNFSLSQQVIGEIGHDWGAGGLKDWKYRQLLLFQNENSGTDLTNFPVMIRLDNTRIDYSKVQAAGEDLIFYDADLNTTLAYEIEKWDSAGTSIIWVKVPKIDASSKTDHIWMYYGNADAPPGADHEAVWETEYKAVLHMGTSLDDSTANDNDGTNNGTTVQLGSIGEAREFDGASQWVELPNSSSLDVSGTENHPFCLVYLKRRLL